MKEDIADAVAGAEEPAPEKEKAQKARPPRGMDFNDVLLRAPSSLPPEGEGGAERRKGDVEDECGSPSSTSPFRPSGTFPLRGKVGRYVGREML